MKRRIEIKLEERNVKKEFSLKYRLGNIAVIIVFTLYALLFNALWTIPLSIVLVQLILVEQKLTITKGLTR